MANGLDRFPGHAYAPGMEPKFWDSFLAVGPDATGGMPALPMILAVVILLALYTARTLGPRGRMRRGSNGHVRRGNVGTPLGSGPDPTQAEIIAKTVMDRNFARELRVSRSLGRVQSASEGAD
jgi:hypothetical protein